MKVLVIDVGGTNVKFAMLTRPTLDGVEISRVASGPDMTARQMVDRVGEVAKGWEYESVSIGFPAPVIQGKIMAEPKNLGAGWVGFDFTKAFGKPVRVINDAAMQALGSYEGGCMLFIGLGTGMGSALITDNVIAPMELAHLPYCKDRTFEDYVGERGLRRMGKRRWREAVSDVVARLTAALVADYTVIGGGNAKRLEELPERARLGSNRNAMLGGYRLWEGSASLRKTGHLTTPPSRKRRKAK